MTEETANVLVRQWMLTLMAAWWGEFPAPCDL